MTGPRPADDVLTLVISPDPLARAGLASLLDAEGGIEVSDAATPSELGATADPDAEVWVWDLGGAASSDDPGRLPGDLPVPLLVLAPDVDSGGAALREGASGVLPRDVDGATLALAVKAAAAGLVVTDPRFFDAPERVLEAADNPLTPRELEVLDLIADGLSNRDIGTALGISAHTAKFHVKAILDKLDAASRTDAVVQAVRRGWLRL